MKTGWRGGKFVDISSRHTSGVGSPAPKSIAVISVLPCIGTFLCAITLGWWVAQNSLAALCQSRTMDMFHMRKRIIQIIRRCECDGAQR